VVTSHLHQEDVIENIKHIKHIGFLDIKNHLEVVADKAVTDEVVVDEVVVEEVQDKINI